MFFREKFAYIQLLKVIPQLSWASWIQSILPYLTLTAEMSHYSVICKSNSQKYFPIETSDTDFLISESIIKGV
jgi:hypothetical protein